MKLMRTRHFYFTLRAVLGFSALFLAFLFSFGRKLAIRHFDGMTELVFSVFALAAASFLLFCFYPYFKGDRRWFSISAILTVVFFAGLTVLWQTPIPVAVA